MQTLHNWAYNGDRLWTSMDGQHRDYGRVLEIPPHPKTGDIVETDTGKYRLGEPLMEDKPVNWLPFIVILTLLIVGSVLKRALA